MATLANYPKYGGTVLRKMVLSYSVLAALLIGIIALFMVSATNRMVIDEISKESRYRLEQVIGFTEESLLTKYAEAFKNKIHPSLQSESDGKLLFFLHRERRMNEYAITELVGNLNRYKYAFSETENIMVYFKKGDFIVDQDYFYESPYSYEDSEFIQSLPDRVPHQWAPRTTSDGRKMLTYVFTLPYMSKGDAVQGYAVLDISVEQLAALYGKMMYSERENLYILDGNGRLVMSLSDRSEDELRTISKLQRDTSQNFIVTSGESGKKIVSYSDAGQSMLGWRYAMIRPMDSLFLSSQQLRKQMLTVCAIVLVFGLCVSYIVSRRFYMPLKQLLFAVRNLYGLPKPFDSNNEYNLINGAIDHLDRKINNLQDELKLKQWIQALNGSFRNVNGHLLIPMNRQYLVARIWILNGSSDQLASLFMQATHSLPYELVMMGDKEAIVIYLPHEDVGKASALAQEDLEKFMLLSRQSIRTQIAVGELVASIDEVHRSYDTAKEAHEYFFLYADRSILSYRDITGRSGSSPIVSFEAYRNALKAGDVLQLETFLSQLQLSLRDGGIHIEAVRLTLVQLVGSLAQTAVELNLQRMLPIAGLFEDFNKETLEETVAWAYRKSEELITYLSANAVTAHQDTVYRLKEYIDQHFFEDISLDTLAEVAGLSTSYVSTLFGEVMNVSFSEYLTSLRLKKAGELLCSSKKSVKDISGMVGYRNVQYFCTKFKERYGVTPVQYRSSQHPQEQPSGTWVAR